jgi:nicotinate-nucleotide adenylyltransferase
MPVWYLVPDGVVQYIEKRDLYREVPRRAAVDGVRPNHSQTPNTHPQEVPR